ncbi:MAG: hypothetical protein IJY80_05815, partial [Opitutales bacterium]|nr:hypothetical protein [Opitutales bacterium]
WTDSAFAQHSALATTDVAVFNDTAQNKNVALNANSTVAGILFDNTDVYAISGLDYTISAGYLTKENSGSVAIDSGLNISENLSVEAGTLSLNGTATAGTATLAAGTTLAGTGTLTTNSLVLHFGETTFDGITASVIGSATRFQSTTKTETRLNFLNGATLDDRNAYYAVTGALNLNGDETTGGTLYVGGLRLSDGGDVQSQLNVGKNVHLVITVTDAGQTGSFELSHWGNGLSSSNLSNTVSVAGKLTSNAIISNWDTSANLNVVSGGELNLLKGLTRDKQLTDGVTVRVESGATINAAGGIQHSSLGVNLKEGSTLGGIASTPGGTATFTNNFILGTSSASTGSVTVDTDIKTVSDFILTENSGGTIDLAGTIAGLGETRINVTGSGNLTLSGTTSVAGIDVGSGATLSLAGTLLVTNLSAALIENAGTVSVTDSAVFAFSGDAATLNAGISTQLFSVVGSGSVNGTLDRSNILWNGKGLAERTEFAYDASTGTVSLSGSAALNLTWNGGATGTWNKTDEIFTVDGTESQTSVFYDLDNVTLATVDAAVALGSAVHVDTLFVAENATLTSSAENTFFADSISVNVGKTLTLSGEDADYSLTQISLKADATLALDAKTASFSQTVFSNGNISVRGGTTTFSEGTTISGGAVSIDGGSAVFPSLSVSGGEFAVSAGTADIETFSQVRGKTTLSGGTTEIASATLSGGEIEISGGTTTIANLTVSGGKLNLLGGTNSVELLSAANGTATISGTGTITASQRVQLNPGGNLIIGNVGEAGPAINTAQIHIHNSANSATTETLTINSGSITVTSTDKNQNTNSGVLIGHWKDGAGVLTLNDGVLNAKNTYTTVSWDSAGTLNINGGEYNTYGIALGGAEGNATRWQNATVNLNGGRLNLGAGGIT